MPWRPPDELPARVRDIRRDPYRERAAILTSRGDLDATLFLRMETHWTQMSGHLWWRLWSEPRELPHGYMVFTNGELDDWIVYPDDLGQNLADWTANKLRYVGELLDVEWLDDKASRHVRDHVPGLDAP